MQNYLNNYPYMAPYQTQTPYYQAQTPVPTYQNQLQQNSLANQQQSPANPYESSFFWVNDKSVVDNYLVAPNNKVYFMDTGLKNLYIKSTDASGRPMPIEAYHLSKESESQPAGSGQTYVTAEELERKLNELNNKFVIRKDRS